MIENKAEKLVYWYLRFNGYFTVENFTVHPEFKKASGTEADILAVRFPYSTEEPRKFHFDRDPQIVIPDLIDFIIGEVKSGECAVNENSWGNPEKRHMHYALSWMGFLASADLDAVATILFKQTYWQNKQFSVRWLCFGSYFSEELDKNHPGLRQILHKDLVNFLVDRLAMNCHALERENWDPFIQKFARMVTDGKQTRQILDWIRPKGQ